MRRTCAHRFGGRTFALHDCIRNERKRRRSCHRIQPRRQRISHRFNHRLQNSFGKFAIPESYYVTDVEVAFEGYYNVKYLGQNFYCAQSVLPSASKVAFEDGVSPYPDVTLTIAGESIDLSGNTVTNDYTIKFLGYDVDDATKIFVMATYNGEAKYGSVSKDAFRRSSSPITP